MAKAAAKADKAFDAIATAALDLGIDEEAITVGEEETALHLLVEDAGGRTYSTRVARDGFPTTARARAGVAANVAQSVANLLAMSPPPELAAD